MTAPSGPPRTVRTFLFDGADGSAELAQALHRSGATTALKGGLGRLTRAARRAVGERIAAAAWASLDLPLADLVIAGWMQSPNVRMAARRSLPLPVGQEIVTLARHRITSMHFPSVELSVDEVLLATVRFRLCVEFAAGGGVAVLRAGRLVGLRCGRTTVIATLAVERRRLLDRRAELDLDFVAALGDGRSVLDAAGYDRPLAPAGSGAIRAPRLLGLPAQVHRGSAAEALS
jgi:hypothetical protein